MIPDRQSDGPAALIYFILLGALPIRVTGTLGGGYVCVCVGGGGGGGLNTWLRFVYISERKLTSVIAYAILTKNVLDCVVDLFHNTKNSITIWRNCKELLFLCLRLCQPDGKFCHILGVVVGNLCFLSISHLTCLFRALWFLVMHTFLVPLRAHVHSTTGFQVSMAGSSMHRLWWQHPAEDVSALTKLTQCD